MQQYHRTLKKNLDGIFTSFLYQYIGEICGKDILADFIDLIKQGERERVNKIPEGMVSLWLTEGSLVNIKNARFSEISV